MKCVFGVYPVLNAPEHSNATILQLKPYQLINEFTVVTAVSVPPLLEAEILKMGFEIT